MRLTVSELRREYRDQIDFQTYDYTKPLGERRARELSVPSHPAVLLLDASGKVAQRFYGVYTADDLRPSLEQLLGE